MTDKLLIETAQDLKDRFLGLLDSLSTLHEVSALESCGQTEQELLANALDVLIRNQDLERCSIFVVEDHVLVNAAGLERDPKISEERDPHRSTTRFRVGEGVMGLAASTGTLQHAHDCSKDPRFKLDSAVDTTPHGCLISAPIAIKGRILAVLNAFHPQPNFFSVWHERLLVVFCNIVAHLLFNNRLFRRMEQEVQERTQQLEHSLAKTRELKQRYEELSVFDELTQIHNRRFFFPEGRAALSRATRHDHAISIMIMDLDNFKLINDTYGHLKGDEVLREAASLLQRNIREGDILARFGGDEFILALPHTNCEAAKILAERIRAGIAAIRVKHESLTISLTASIGITSREGESAETSTGLLDILIREADQALYECKRHGRNWVHVYEQDENDERTSESDSSTELSPNLH